METMTLPSYGLEAKVNALAARKKVFVRSQLKTGIWMYFLLLIFEGALRKWFLPFLAGPLLIVRDPIAFWILFTAVRHGYILKNQYVSWMVAIGLIGLYTAYFLGHGNIYVAIYGARILVLHFPLIFVIAKVFDKQDVLKIARATLVISIPMTLLIIMQFYSPQTAWINKSLGGEAGGGFSGAMNFYRPPGTFSFTNGNTLFYSFCSCLVVYFWFNPKEISRWVLILASIGLLLSIPFSISRSLLFQVVISLLFSFCSVLLKPKYALGILLVMIGVTATFVLLSYTPYFTTATAAFTSRFETANEQEGGLNGVFLDRFLGGMIGAIAISAQQPFFGYGIGMGTNVGSMLLGGGRGFLISEGEWGRLIGELGPVLGLTVIFLRLKFAFELLFRSLKSMVAGNILPWMLTSFGFLAIAQHGWAQPTSLGFSIIITGLILASFEVPGKRPQTPGISSRKVRTYTGQ
jgi:hypothetical protein